MHYASQELNGVHSSVANVGVSEKNGFNFQHHEKDLFDVPASCLNFDSQNLMCESSGDQSAPLFGSVVDSFFSSHGDTFCELYEHFRNKQNDILEGDASAPVNRVGDSCFCLVFCFWMRSMNLILAFCSLSLRLFVPLLETQLLAWFQLQRGKKE